MRIKDYWKAHPSTGENNSLSTKYWCPVATGPDKIQWVPVHSGYQLKTQLARLECLDVGQLCQYYSLVNHCHCLLPVFVTMFVTAGGLVETAGAVGSTTHSGHSLNSPVVEVCYAVR